MASERGTKGFCDPFSIHTSTIHVNRGGTERVIIANSAPFEGRRSDNQARRIASDNGSGMSETPANQDPELLRRLLRAKDRMDAASHEAWPVRRLARVSGVSAGPLRAIVQGGLRRPAAPLPAHAANRAGHGAAARHRPVRSPRSPSRRAGQPGHVRAHVPRRHRREPGRDPGARAGRGARARQRARLLSQRRAPARPHDRSFGEAAPAGGRYKRRPENKEVP